MHCSKHSVLSLFYSLCSLRVSDGLFIHVIFTVVVGVRICLASETGSVSPKEFSGFLWIESKFLWC